MSLTTSNTSYPIPPPPPSKRNNMIPPPPPTRPLSKPSIPPPPPPKRSSLLKNTNTNKETTEKQIGEKRAFEEKEINSNNGNTEPLLKKRKLLSEKKNSFDAWNHYSVIFWLNRVNNGKLAYIEYQNLRKHIFIGKINGNELCQFNDVILRMIGIYDKQNQQLILSAINDLISNDNFSNIVHDTIITDTIPYEYCDPITYEIMQDPVSLNVSGNIHERLVIEAYIKRFNKDPISQKDACLDDLVSDNKLKQKIDVWRKANFNL